MLAFEALLFPVGLPFVCAVYALGHLCGLDASAFLSHTSLSFPKSLKRKLTVLQETLNLPPVASDTVNRLVLERFVGAVGWCRSDRPEGLPGKGPHCSWPWWGGWSTWAEIVDLLPWEQAQFIWMAP